MLARLLTPIRVAARSAARIAREVNRLRVRRRLRHVLPLPKPCEDGYVLFFTPEAGVDPHLVAQCVLGRTLQERGHKVLFARCFDLLRRCPVMDMHALPYALPSADRERVCLDCAAGSFRRLEAYGLPVFDLRTVATPDLQAQVSRALAAAPEDLREFVYDGVMFGKLCAMDLVLANKVSDLSVLAPEHRRAWLEYIETSLTSYLVTQAICAAIPVRRLVVFNDYSLLLGARLGARKHGVETVSVTLAPHRSVDRRRYVLSRDPISVELARQTAAWSAWRDLALPPDVVKEIGEDTLARLGATQAHVYSPPKTFGTTDLQTRLGLDRGRKLLVAFTSSLDEMMATSVTRSGLGFAPPVPPQPFADQIEWLQAVIDRVEASSDLQFVVRIHPREGVNKRDRIASQHLGRLKSHFDRPFRHSRFVWPDDPISSYDLGELADVSLVSWSTIGLELARMGVPVLTSTNGLAPFPHDDFLEWGRTPAAYFDRLNELLNRPPCLDTVARAFRWYNLYHLGLSLDLGDIVPTPYSEGLPPFQTPRETETIDRVVLGDANVFSTNHSRLLINQPVDATEREWAAIRRHLRRLIRFIFTGQVQDSDYALVMSGGATQGVAGEATLTDEGAMLRFSSGGRSWVRASPLCRRLAPLCSQEAATTPR